MAREESLDEHFNFAVPLPAGEPAANARHVNGGVHFPGDDRKFIQAGRKMHVTDWTLAVLPEAVLGDHVGDVDAGFDIWRHLHAAQRERELRHVAFNATRIPGAIRDLWRRIPGADG